MTVLDILVPARAWRFASVRTTTLGAETACLAVPDPFRGVDLLRGVFGVEGRTVAACLTGAAPIPVVEALTRRGAVVVNDAGRCGVVVGVNLVVQPAGRRWGLADTSGDWWVSGWWMPGVVSTRSG